MRVMVSLGDGVGGRGLSYEVDGEVHVGDKVSCPYGNWRETMETGFVVALGSLPTIEILRTNFIIRSPYDGPVKRAHVLECPTEHRTFPIPNAENLPDIATETDSRIHEMVGEGFISKEDGERRCRAYKSEVLMALSAILQYGGDEATVVVRTLDALWPADSTTHP